MESYAARARYPAWFFLAGAAPASRFGGAHLNAFRSAHGGPVVRVFRGAQQTHLVIVTVGRSPRPGELVGTTPEPEDIHKFLRHGLFPG